MLLDRTLEVQDLQVRFPYLGEADFDAIRKQIPPSFETPPGYCNRVAINRTKLATQVEVCKQRRERLEAAEDACTDPKRQDKFIELLQRLDGRIDCLNADLLYGDDEPTAWSDSHWRLIAFIEHRMMQSQFTDAGSMFAINGWHDRKIKHADWKDDATFHRLREKTFREAFVLGVLDMTANFRSQSPQPPAYMAGEYGDRSLKIVRNREIAKKRAEREQAITGSVSKATQLEIDRARGRHHGRVKAWRFVRSLLLPKPTLPIDVKNGLSAPLSDEYFQDQWETVLKKRPSLFADAANVIDLAMIGLKQWSERWSDSKIWSNDDCFEKAIRSKEKQEYKTPKERKLSENPVTAKIVGKRLSDVIPKAIDWLWKNKIPAGSLTVLAGRGGTGKSTMYCDLVARLTTGRPLPGDTTKRELITVLIINREDDDAAIIRPRLESAGADLDRVVLIDAVRMTKIASTDIDERWIDFSDRTIQQVIQEAIVATDAKLLVIDPITGHIGSKKQNDAGEIRGVLQPIQAIANSTGCTILGVTHSPKTSSSAAGSVIGSQAFTSTARGALVVVKDPNDPARRICLNAKTNYAADTTGLAFSIKDQDGIGRVDWEDNPITDDPDSFFAEASPQRSGMSDDRNATDSATLFLSNFLGQGAKPQKEVMEAAKAELIATRTLQRAKERLGVTSAKRGDCWYWVPLLEDHLGND